MQNISFTCPHCGSDVRTPPALDVKFGDSVFFVCSVCAEWIILVHLPRSSDNIRVYPLEAKVMASPIGLSEKSHYAFCEVNRRLEEDGLMEVYLDALKKAMVDKSNWPEPDDYATTESGPITETEVDTFFSGALKLPRTGGFGK